MTDPRAKERVMVDETDYADLDLESADDVHVARGPAPLSTFAVRLDGETIEQLRRLAETQGARPTQLVRRWIEQRVQMELDPPPMFKINPAASLEKLRDNPAFALLRTGDVDEVVESVATAMREALTRIAERVES